jgi:integrase
MNQKLTVRSVESISPSEKDMILWDDEVTGFGLKVTPKGKRSFFLYYRCADHTQRRPVIGYCPAMRPEQARNLAKDWLVQVRRGGDPSADRKAKRAMRGEGTVADLFEDYKREKARLRSLYEIIRIFERDILPTLGKRRAEEVKRSDVNRLLDNLSVRSPTVASNARKRLSAFFSWALSRLPDDFGNPVTGAVAAPPPAARERTLSSQEITALWHVLGKELEPWQSALRLMILTGQRRGEVFGANWSEFDLEEKSWTIPAARTKNGNTHIVPLSAPVLEVLQNKPPSGPVVIGTDETVRFSELTARSVAEVRGIHWREIDLKKGVWRIPRVRSVTKKVVEVALSDVAQAFLKELKLIGPLFYGSNRGFSRSALRIREALNNALPVPAESWSWHDIRRTAATNLQRLGSRLEVTEAILNHVGGTRAGIVGVYQRYEWLDEKRDALEAWAGEVMRWASPDEVVSVRYSRSSSTPVPNVPTTNTIIA